MPFKTVDEIFKIAIQMEEKAYQFYNEALNLVKKDSPESGALLEKLAQEELHHKEMLEQFDLGDLAQEYIQFEPDLSVYNTIKKTPITKDMKPQEIRTLAAKREQYTREFYLAYADAVSSNHIRELFNTLAEFEKQHIHKINFEFGEYYG